MEEGAPLPEDASFDKVPALGDTAVIETEILSKIEDLAEPEERQDFIFRTPLL